MDTPHQTARIVALPDHISTRINSSSHITSLDQVVIGLLENSLDAKACKIDITVDFARGACTVEDNGHGIGAVNFETTGGLCKAHHTSKLHAEHKHSSNGSFLAALSVLSLLSIKSSIGSESDASSLKIHNGRIISRRVLDPELYLEHSHGTIVTMNDLFGNMPVRVKQRALSHINVRTTARSWQSLKHDVVATVLCWKYPCRVRVSSVQFADDNLLLSTIQASISDKLTSKLLDKLLIDSETISLRNRLVILSQAGLIASHDRSQWIPLSSSSRRFEIKGAIHIEASPTKSCQFISIGINRVGKSSSHSVLYDNVNQIFDQSKFSMISDGAIENGSSKTNTATRGVDRWPMFVLQIVLKDDSILPGGSITTEAILTKLLKLLSATIRQWLKEQGMLGSTIDLENIDPISTTEHTSIRTSKMQPRSVRRQHGETTPATHYPGTVELHDNHLSWSVLRHGTATVARSSTFATEPAELMQQQAVGPPQDSCERADTTEHSCCRSSDVYGNISSSTLAEMNDITCELEPRDQTDSGSKMKWRDPKTTKWYDIDTRTGHSTLCIEAGKEKHSQMHDAVSSKLVHRTASAPTSVALLPESLKAWQPSLFQPPSGTRIQRADSAYDFANQQLHESLPFQVLPPLLDAESMSRHSLRAAKVIGQVDAKYILCHIFENEKYSGNDKLVLIDQHAASERIILERLFTSLCRPADPAILMAFPGARYGVQGFEGPLRFEITSNEYRLFGVHAMYFASWSIFFDLEVQESSAILFGKGNQSEHRLIVKTVPPVIYERCKNTPSIVIQLMRQTIWQIENDHQTTTLQTRNGHGAMSINTCHAGRWLDQIANCPQGLIDLLNSRACRSAIMFNDILSFRECDDLIKELSKTAFPFICAHGRVSVVPILQLADNAQAGDELADTMSSGFIDQYRRWRNDS